MLGKLFHSKEDTIGSIVGYIYYGDVTILHCYWTNDGGYSDACGGGYPPEIPQSTIFNSTTFELSKTVSVGNYTGTSLLSALNAFVDKYYIYNEYSHWLLSKDNKDASFTINNRTKSFTLDPQLILLPNLAMKGDCGLMGGTLMLPARSLSLTLKSQQTYHFMGNGKRTTIITQSHLTQEEGQILHQLQSSLEQLCNSQIM